jgi:hypothetical protein
MTWRTGLILAGAALLGALLYVGFIVAANHGIDIALR